MNEQPEENIEGGGIAVNKYYPYGFFCDKYGCWCDDVVDITDNQNDCNGNCEGCAFSSEPEKY